jgi:hypothetical protein
MKDSSPDRITCIRVTGYFQQGEPLPHLHWKFVTFKNKPFFSINLKDSGPVRISHRALFVYFQQGDSLEDQFHQPVRSRRLDLIRSYPENFSQ